MALSRRQFFQMGALQVGAMALPLGSQSAMAAPLRRWSRPSIAQGATDSSSAQFSVVHPADSRYLFEAKDIHSGQLLKPHDVKEFSHDGQRQKITQVFFKGLQPQAEYFLILRDAFCGDLVEKRVFRALDQNKKELRFAICSCMDDRRHSPDIWKDLVDQNPDFIIFAGDSTYCDYGSENDRGSARLWRRFSEARATLEIYFSDRLIPILATWDDHDFGQNDVGRDFPYLKESQINFMQFFAMNAEWCFNLERGPGVSSRCVLGGQQFFLMDDRSFRIGNQSDDRYAHWGREQEEWLLRHVSAHSGVSWIVNGSQMFPHMILKESFSAGHPVQFHSFRESLKQMTGRRTIFVSGDVHFSEISQINVEELGYASYELTSSSIHSSKVPGAPMIIPNERRIVSTGRHNYLLVSSVGVGAGARLLVESRSPMGQVNFVQDLSVV